MARKLVYSGLVAGLLCGCQSTRHDACCDDCVPPKSHSCGYWPCKDKVVTKLTAKDCADDDLKSLQKSCGKTTKDFEAGFRQAYVDLAMGRPALVPPVPPSQYWNAYYRSCAGAEAVAQWFEGYRAGLEIGSQGGVSRFNRIATSWDCGLDGSGGAYPAAPGLNAGWGGYALQDPGARPATPSAAPPAYGTADHRFADREPARY